uniref:BTB domain-containing protein n=1 Tax=Ditylenchus dipsaci TaxID=166011 RepID=A0A915DAS4_9BILA
MFTQIPPLIPAKRRNLRLMEVEKMETDPSKNNVEDRYKQEGSLTLKIDRFSEFASVAIPASQQILSTPVYIRGLPWRILAVPRDAGSRPNSFSKRGVDDNTRKIIHTFQAKENDFGYSQFLKIDSLLDPNNGYIKDDTVLLQVDVSAGPHHKFKEGMRGDEFLTSGLVESDCTIVVEGHRFPVNKGLLSAYSSYFKVLFFGQFCEKNQDEVELKEVKAIEFLHLLKAIYPAVAENLGWIRENVECLLRLSDLYQVKAVKERCASYLRKCAISEVPLHEKLLYAQDYNLLELLHHCIMEYKKFADVKKLRATTQYSRLDDKIKLQIYENVE